MLKQSPSKNLRAKGFKVKHVLQICLLLAIFFWLLHLVRHSYEEKKAYEESKAKLVEVQNEHESIKLGRRDLRFPVQQTTSETEKQGNQGEIRDEEEEEIKPENSNDEGRGGGDDEIDGNDQEKSEEEESEEVEDLIDEEDREREDEAEEQQSQEVENQFEDERLLVNQVQYRGESKSEAREKNTAGR